MKKLLLILSFWSFSGLAEPTLLDKGQSSPYKGWLFTPEDELKNRSYILGIEALNASNTRLIDLYKAENTVLLERSNLWQDQSLKLSKELTSERDSSSWKQALWFVAGALITTAIVFGVNKASK